VTRSGLRARGTRRPRVSPVVLSCTVLLAGCGSQGAGSSVSIAAPAASTLDLGSGLAAEQTLRRSLDDEPRSLDPLLTNDVEGQRIADDLFEGLTTIDLSGKVVPGVASSWETSPDGLVWTFHLRAEARWSNGAAVTAHDFVYAWRREVDPKTAAAYAQALEPIAQAAQIASGQAPLESLGVEALDEHTLRVTLSGPTPYLLDLLSMQFLYPVYEPAIRQYGDDWVRPQHLVCNGAFVLRERLLADRIVLEKSPSYWDAAHVRLQRVTYYILHDQNDETQRFMADELDWTDSYAANQRAWLRSTLGDQVVSSPYFGSYFLGMNFQLPPFKDNLPLRKALVLALDREPMVRSLRQGLNEPAYTLMPPLPDYKLPIPDWSHLPDAQRHALARTLYSQAGYSDRHPLRVDLEVPSQGADARHFFEAVIANWHSVLGADVQLYERDFTVLAQERALHKLPLFFDGWIGDYPDPNTFMQIRYTGNGNNNADYSNRAYDRLIDTAGQTVDRARRYALFQNAEILLNEDAAYIPLYYYATRHLVKPYLRGWQSNVMNRNPSRYMYLLEHREH
jgi:oligopeptide transport system substrate-binding protein